MKNIIVLITLLIISSCRTDDPNATPKFQFSKPVNNFLEKRQIAQQLSDIEPGAGASGNSIDKNNSHLDPQNYIYWQSDYYRQISRFQPIIAP